MSDIADIGFRADSSDLDKAVLSLNKLKNASKGVGDASNQVTRAVTGNSKAMAVAAVQVSRAVVAKGKADLQALQVSKSATKAQIEQAKHALKLAQAEQSTAKSILATAQANESLKKATNSATQAQVKQLSVMQRINKTTGLSRGMPKSARDSAAAFGGIANDQMPNRFNTANIAAQFQDIGVTAAMGMNPMTIALQQGTQLSAILNSMESPLAGLKQAFTSIINPVSLMAIGFTAILVTLIQFVNWGNVAQGILYGLANVIETTAPFVLSLAAALAILYAPAIITGIATTITSIALMGKTALVTGTKMAAAWIIGMGPVAWVAAGIAVVLAALFAFREQLANLLGVDVLGMIKSGVNKIIGFFIGAYKGIVAAWSAMPGAVGAIVIAVANGILGTLERMINEVVERINKLPGVELDIKFDGKGGIPDPTGKAKEAGAIMGAEMEKALSKDYVGAIGDAVGGLANKLRGVASGIGKEDEDKKKKGASSGSSGKTELDKYEDIINGANRRIETLKAEQAAIGLTEQATARLKYETELLNQAMQKGIELTPEQRRELGELAETMSRIEEETRKAKEAMEFAKTTTRGFFGDLKNGLKEGMSLWEAFGNAALNALNKIFDRMIDSGIDMIFEGLGNSGTFGVGGGGGSNILSSIGSLFSGGVTANADGNAFTNGIYSSPTMFKFAGGGQFGVMGEAGPEAVMPLHRGSDGSLGVRMDGNGGGGSNVTVNVYGGDGNSKVEQREGSGGIEIDVMVDEIAAQKIGEPGTLMNRALTGHNNRSLIKR